MINKIYEKGKKFITQNYLFIIFLAFIIIFFNIKLPFIVSVPGGNINLNERITIDGESDNKGSYNMAYVSVYEGSLPIVLLSFIIPNWDLESLDNVILENQDYEEKIIMDKIMMDASIDAATILAYEKAQKDLTIDMEYMNIYYIDQSAETNLLIGDKVISVDGKKFFSSSEITDYFQTLEKDAEVKLIVLRDNKTVTATAKLQEIDGELKIGIVFVPTYDYTENPETLVFAKEEETGPSGGLMLSLAIYDKLIEKDLTAGKKIVGTGTIDIDGTVGTIDGIKYKLLGSKDADIFICPEENYEEAISVKEKYDLDMQIYKVNTFNEAVEILNK